MAFGDTPWSVAVITTQTTTVVDTGGGVLGAILIPTLVANATVKVYDGLTTSGRVLIDTITLPGTLLSSGPLLIPLNMQYGTGLTVVTAGATMSLSVLYL
jgi:hypothetical protein